MSAGPFFLVPLHDYEKTPEFNILDLTLDGLGPDG